MTTHIEDLERISGKVTTVCGIVAEQRATIDALVEALRRAISELDKAHVNGIIVNKLEDVLDRAEQAKETS